MRPTILIVFLAFSLLSLSEKSFAQHPESDLETLQVYEDTLQVLSLIMVTDSLEKNRFAAVHKMIPTLVKALKVSNSFDYAFSKLRSISIQYAPDSTFRVFTWQLYVDEDNYRYYGAIQMNADDLQLFPLLDRSFDIDHPAQATALGADNWYGALYYHLMALEFNDQPAYLLFGYDQHSLYRRRKLLDILYFNDKGQPLFGAPVIPIASGNLISRLVLEYSAEAKVSLNYDENLDLIVFDHLIPMEGRFGEGTVNVPDGSYQAFKIENGQLVFIDKVFNEVNAEPLRDATLGAPKKSEVDIFGRKKGKN